MYVGTTSEIWIKKTLKNLIYIQIEKKKEYYLCVVGLEYSLETRAAKLDSVQLCVLHMYLPSALACSIKNMCALHISSMWTKAIDPIRAFTADNIL